MALYLQAADLGEESQLNTTLVPIFKALAAQYAKKEAYQEAYQYLQKYQALNDTIYNNETKERIAQMETSYELEVNKAERKRLEAEMQKREAQIKQRTVLAVGSTLVTVLLAILLVGYYRANSRKRVTNKILGNQGERKNLRIGKGQ